MVTEEGEQCIRTKRPAPLEQVGVEWEEAVQGVGVGGHAVAPRRAADHRQQLTVVALYDGVAENHLVLPGAQKHTVHGEQPGTSTSQYINDNTEVSCFSFNF